MNRFSTIVVVVVLGVAMLGLTGCNLFDGTDSALHARTDEELIEEGNLALESGDFTASNERFDELLAHGIARDEVFRGKGETLAGQAGFRFLASLDALQNGVGPYDTAPVCFRCASLVRDRPLMVQGITWMNRLGSPDRSDRMARALMKVGAAVRLLLDKYDTNNNRRLDQYDEIDFDTNDGKTPTWPSLYQDLVTGPAADGETLEQAFLDLARGFDGRGDPWVLLSPVAGQTASGTFSASNRATIQAVGDLVDRLAAAHPYYNVHVASFAAAIRLLDGAE